jgi:hypothetical protein
VTIENAALVAVARNASVRFFPNSAATDDETDRAIETSRAIEGAPVLVTDLASATRRTIKTALEHVAAKTLANTAAFENTALAVEVTDRVNRAARVSAGETVDAAALAIETRRIVETVAVAVARNCLAWSRAIEAVPVAAAVNVRNKLLT